jgi:predicted NBD/HSP70 family sugar kinase
VPLAPDEAAELRHRAHALRIVAAQLGACTVNDLPIRGGGDTWIGPTPQLCLDDLMSLRRRLRQAQDDFVTAAVGLERRADVVDAAALSPGLLS